MFAVQLDPQTAREILAELDRLAQSNPETRHLRDRLWDALISARDRSVEESAMHPHAYREMP